MRLTTSTIGVAAVASLALTATTANGQGQSAEQGTAVTLQAAVRIALDSNPQQRAAREGVRAASAAVGETRAAYYPEVYATAGYRRFEQHAFLPDALARPGVSPSIGPTDDWSAGLAGRYTLYDGGSRAATLRAVLARRDVADAEAAEARQDLALDVHRAYYGLLAAREARIVAEQDARRAADHLRLAEERRAAGAVPGGDVARAQVAVSEGELRLAIAEHNVRVAAGRLNTTMGLPADIPIDIAMPQEPIVPTPASPISESIEQALRQRAELAAGRDRVVAARAGLDAAQSAFRPRAIGEWRYGWRDQAWWPTDRDWSVSVAVQWSLFDGFARDSARTRARAELAREAALVDQQALRVREDVWRARSALIEAFETVQASDAMVAEAQESVRTTRERYRVGAGTVTDLLDVEAALTRAGAARVQAAWEYRSASAVWRWALGELPVS